MCEGFGAIIDKDFNLYFCEPDNQLDCSHSEIIRRLGWKENTNQHLRNFVRVQCPDWTDKTFEFDERESLPGWVDEDRIKGLVERQLEKITPAWAEYKRINGPAWAEYERINGLAWAEYKRINGPAWAEFVEKLSHLPGYVGERV